MTKQGRFCVKLAKEVLRLKFILKQSNRQIGKALSISKTTVATYLMRAKALGLDEWGKVELLDENFLQNSIFPSPPGPTVSENVDFEWVHKELKKKHVTLMLIWKELSFGKEKFYRYSRFCELFRYWKKDREISMRIPHKAGEKLFIDYAGSTIPIIIDRRTGEIREAQIFVTCLGASQYCYAEATWSQQSRDFIQSNIHAFNYMGGVTEILVPDNLKSGVNLASKYEPSINQSYREMAKHFECVVIPARAYRPKDKAKVENGVLVVSRWIIAALRNRTFFSLEELNEVIWELLEELNDRPFQKIKSSRRLLFNEVDRPALKPLPAIPFVIAEWKKAKLNIDYHIQLEGCFYSAPFRLRGKDMNVRFTLTTVEIFYQETRVASHARKHRPNDYSTIPEHMPRAHREYLEWSPSRMLQWGSKIGPFTESVFQKLMDTKEHPELAYKACLGIISLGKKFGNERLEKASQRAMKLKVVSYRSLKSILENNLDRVEIREEQQELPLDHENIRGENYYQ